MSTGRHIDKICIAVTAVMLIITILFMNGKSLGLTAAERTMGYESLLFDTGRVHSIDIVMNDWDGFIENCENEEYSSCTVVIDGKSMKNVGIRAKGNTSLSSVRSMGSQRYSFKIEFDRYESGKSYYGLDKLCLNNMIQDNTMMKDYLAYQLMDDFGVDAPLSSYAYLTVNGEDWGLYLAVEAVEDGFLQRNYGNENGDLYKPDSMSFGGGRGNGKDFDFGGFNFGMGSDDVKLKYIDDDPDSYSNIFGSAKTTVTEADKKRLIRALKNLSEYEDLENTLDMDEVLSYFVVHGFLCNGDSYTGSMIHNYYLYEDGGRLSMIPWDYNLAFGTFMGGDASSSVNASVDNPVSGGNVNDRPMIGWIFSSDEYIEAYHERYAEFIDEWFSDEKLEQIISETAEMIRSYVEKDPTRFCSVEEFDKGVETLSSFVALRAEAVSRQLNGDSTAVATNGLNLSDMGSMGGGGGFGRGNSFGRSKDRNSSDSSSEGREPEENQDDSSVIEGTVISFTAGAAESSSVDSMPQWGDFGDMPEGGFGDMPQWGDFGDMPEGGFGDMPQWGDFGDMPEGGFGDMPQWGGFGDMPEGGSGDTPQWGSREDSSQEEQKQIPDSGNAFPGGSRNFTGRSSGMSSQYTNLIWVLVSVVILIVGLVIAKKKKY